MSSSRSKNSTESDGQFPQRHSLGIDILAIICGAALAVVCVYLSGVEFTGENAWLNEPGAWLLVAVLGVAFMAGGFMGIAGYIVEKDPKFHWVDWPKESTGRPEPLMRYDKTCPLCKGAGIHEIKKLDNGMPGLHTHHAKCDDCGYDISFPALSKAMLLVLLVALLVAGFFMAHALYLNGGIMALLLMVPQGFVIFMMGMMIYMINSYLIMRNKAVERHMDRKVISLVKEWHSSKK